ncbi:Sialate O-acetylesterase [Hypsibius exemplaris]|uniref:Sialate O-acetylesterase n=1 Tax=Hypsibius exemplaris TaxID=2072580 RepID=A0A1W0WJI4_HYPEX|nr:Sialate O-acetylesterase [Hypsibius exemplaris]
MDFGSSYSTAASKYNYEISRLKSKNHPALLSCPIRKLRVWVRALAFILTFSVIIWITTKLDGSKSFYSRRSVTDPAAALPRTSSWESQGSGSGRAAQGGSEELDSPVDHARTNKAFPTVPPGGHNPLIYRQPWHYPDGLNLSPESQPKHGVGGTIVEFRFANYFHDAMVLQSGEPGPDLWGYGEVNRTVTIRFDVDHEFNVTVNESGIWRVRLPARGPGGPHSIYATSKVGDLRPPKNIDLHSVLFGDVWLCGGQSNMEFQVEWMVNGTEELKGASSYPLIRFMEVRQAQSPAPLSEVQIKQEWSLPNHVTLREFSGLCWAFGRRLHEKLKIPIGLIGSYYGGSPIMTWTDKVVIEKCRKVSGNVAYSYGIGNKSDHSVLWNAMILPLISLELRGMIWFQGESDGQVNFAGFPCMFYAMIDSWRAYFRRPNLPFGFVQLACRPEDDLHGDVIAKPDIRWEQTAFLGVVPNKILKNAFMAVAMDLCDPQFTLGALHSPYKEEIAERLYAGALSMVYNISTPFHGPFPAVISTFKDGNTRIKYEDGPILLRNNISFAFEVCCGKSNSSAWYSCGPWNEAPLSSITDTTVILDTSICKQLGVQFVRYAWRNTPCPYLQCAIYGADTALPAGPFVLPVDEV